MGGQKALGFNQKYLRLCPEDFTSKLKSDSAVMMEKHEKKVTSEIEFYPDCQSELNS